MNAERPLDGQRGFTLIEVLIAVVVLSVALAGMIPVLIHTTRGNTFGDTTTLAATWSQDKIEELLVIPFGKPEWNAGTYGPFPVAPTVTPSAPGNPAFPRYPSLSREWRITDTNAFTKTIEVCTAETATFTEDCFPASGSPSPARHFLAVRTNY